VQHGAPRCAARAEQWRHISPCVLREDIFKEIDILVELEHENVVRLKEYFHEHNKVRARWAL
jgi:hypothetical protein